jgi:uncharacterized membrane protein YoaK (UPF0700 family)
MFSHEGDTRSSRQNRVLAGYLAFVGGLANSSGFVIIGRFTSHVTGNVGRLAVDNAFGKFASAFSAALLILTFFVGAFVGSVILESRPFGHVSRAYALALAIEAALLIAFAALVHDGVAVSELGIDAEAALLCCAMGLQNGLVTRLSGAVVRTTHVTGVVTDLGIESARWFRHWRGALSRSIHVRLVVGAVGEKPSYEKFLLLMTIAGSFLAGSFVGAIGTVRLGNSFMGVAAMLIAACSAYAFKSGSKHMDTLQASRR